MPHKCLSEPANSVEEVGPKGLTAQLNFYHVLEQEKIGHMLVKIWKSEK